MSIKLLKALNPEVDFSQPGNEIWVTQVEGRPVTATLARIVVDKGRQQVRAYDASNRVIVAYPATIGSAEIPAPSGEHRVEGVAPDPLYYFSPGPFVQGGATQGLQLPAGPNSPVGSMWIDLTQPSYGIHGTSDPAKVGKQAALGCVHLTNWDAAELAGLVQPGVPVSFAE